jgi:predicted transcriptional regulator
MDLRVPPELEAKLSRLAVESSRDIDQVALDLLTSAVDHDEWFRHEVERGRISAREGRFLEHAAVATRINEN